MTNTATGFGHATAQAQGQDDLPPTLSSADILKLQLQHFIPLPTPHASVPPSGSFDDFAAKYDYNQAALALPATDPDIATVGALRESIFLQERREQLRKITSQAVKAVAAVASAAAAADSSTGCSEQQASPKDKKSSKKTLQSALADKSTTNGTSSSSSADRERERDPIFPEWVSESALKTGIAEGKYIVGPLRINKRSTLDAYVSVGAGDSEDERDILIYGRIARNRALDGDHVAIELVPAAAVLAERLKVHERRDADRKSRRSKTPDTSAQQAGGTGSDDTPAAADSGDEAAAKPVAAREIDPTQPCGRVVRVVRRSLMGKIIGALATSRPSVGTQQRVFNTIGDFAWLKPIDPRHPLLRIPRDCLPAEYLVRPQDFNEFLWSASFTSWDRTEEYPEGTIEKQLGPIGDIEVYRAAIYEANSVMTDPFSDECLSCLPPVPWEISDEERAKRVDFTGECVVSVDPRTARDLDDACHVRHLGDDTYQLGVHIADVSHFIPAGSALDERAMDVATTVYLVDDVVPMLPRLLCEDLCSLNPDVERLAFSVVWTIRFDQLSNSIEFLDTQFCKSIIRSRAKLAYEQAQEIIDGKPLDIEVDCAEQIEQSIRLLYSISACLRSKRFENGAVSMNSRTYVHVPSLFIIISCLFSTHYHMNVLIVLIAKLSFLLDDSSTPIACQPYVIRDSNRMIEEFMLLANESVAKKIYSHFPHLALLRRHQPPSFHPIKDLKHRLTGCGVDLDASSSYNLQQSLNAIQDPTVRSLVRSLCVRAMKRAEYVCVDEMKEEALRHYALAMDHYTHFTSPIRRAADIVVHRLLFAAIEGTAPPSTLDTMRVKSIAATCNGKKQLSRVAQEASGLLFLCLFLEHRVPKDQVFVAYITAVKEQLIELHVPCFGMDNRIFYESFTARTSFDAKSMRVSFRWPVSGKQTEWTVFQQIQVTLRPDLSKAIPEIVVLPVEEDNDKSKRAVRESSELAPPALLRVPTGTFGPLDEGEDV
ncbi:hypothetical protein BCR44DRAFT_31141 [Catenaria anguillulae PL171]|uniref:RNB domain-containing protein n=1 Tax=Catenaria anguillulae PL171 TaxID=765915 RepID=A0A1Y2HVS0_9FUNG|nr:hypothetical protein BCR44DRAFT_31141 [Catenaria anguillulae PL171]